MDARGKRKAQMKNSEARNPWEANDVHTQCFIMQLETDAICWCMMQDANIPLCLPCHLCSRCSWSLIQDFDAVVQSCRQLQSC